jgi:hypothetical protein
VTIPTVLSGTQRWTGQIEAYHPTTTGGVTSTISCSCRRATGTASPARRSRTRPASSSGRRVHVHDGDRALNARVAPAGGTWATSGSATDFAFADDLSGEQIKRSTTATRAALGDPRVDELHRHAGRGRDDPDFDEQRPATSSRRVARWVDSSNYLRRSSHSRRSHPAAASRPSRSSSGSPALTRRSRPRRLAVV